MKFNKKLNMPYIPSNVLNLYQEGGDMGGSAGQDPLQEVMTLAREAVETGNGEMAIEVLTVLLEMMDAQTGGQEMEQAPTEEMPMEEPMQEARYGGKLRRVFKI